MLDPNEIVIRDNVRKGEASASPSLVASIMVHGIIEPLAVYFDDDESEWVLVAGHRRLAAALEIGLVEVPIHEVNPQNAADVIGMQVAENTQREDLGAWELAQAAWDLKTEGLKQRDVARAMSIPQRDVPKLQKVASKLLSDDDLVSTELLAFSFDGLEMIANAEAKPSDVLTQFEPDKEDVRWSLQQAIKQAEADQIQGDFIESIRDDLTDWSAHGIQVTYEDPRAKTDKRGFHLRDKNVSIIGDGYDELNVVVNDHIHEPCHIVWVHIPNVHQYGTPEVRHCCTNMKAHYSADAEFKASDAETVQAAKEASSAQRAADRQAKKDRGSIARQFVEAKTEVKVLRHLAITRALESVGYNEWTVFGKLLELPRAKGQEWEPLVREWLATQRDPDAALLKLILVSGFYERNHAYGAAAKWVQEEVLPGFEPEKEEDDEDSGV